MEFVGEQFFLADWLGCDPLLQHWSMIQQTRNCGIPVIAAVR